MLTNSFGKHGEEVSRLGFGAMRFEKPEDLDEMAEVVAYAHDKGITYFDTAPYYCRDKSEEIVGLAVKEMKKTGKPFQIATKTGVKTGDEVRRDLERSLQRLNVDAIDYYHVWCLQRPGQMRERMEGGAIDAFRKAKEEGLVRHVSVSTHLEHGQVSEMLDQADGLFEGMLIGLNAINFQMRLDGVRDAARRGLGVATMNTLGGGLLTDNPDVFEYLKRSPADTVLDAALRFNLSLPEVSVALVGFRNKEDVDTATAAVERLELMDAEEMAAFQKKVVASHVDLCTQCNYCDVCPVDIPVLRYMEAYNHRIIAGGAKPEPAVINRLKYYWGQRDPKATLALCTECGQCVEACTQHLPILERFAQIRKDQEKMDAEAEAERKKQEAAKN